MRRFNGLRYVALAVVGVLAIVGVVGTFASGDVVRPSPQASQTAHDVLDDLQIPKPEQAAASEGTDGDGGVPIDSPACENLGCDWVETPGGVQNYLPLPAVEGMVRAQELREAAQQNGNGNGSGEHGRGASGVGRGGPPPWAGGD